MKKPYSYVAHPVLLKSAQSKQPTRVSESPKGNSKKQFLQRNDFLAEKLADKRKTCFAARK